MTPVFPHSNNATVADCTQRPASVCTVQGIPGAAKRLVSYRAALAGATVVLEGPRRGDIESLGAPRISGCVMHLRIQHGPVPGVALNGNDHEGLLRMEGCDGRRTVHVPVHLQASDHLRGGPSDLYENAAPSGQPLPALTSLSPFSLFIP